MSEIVLWKLRDTTTGEELPDKTAFIKRTLPVMTELNVPLYRDGEMIPEDELATLGLEKIGYTQEQLDTAFYAGLYEMNQDLETRVRQYKTMLDNLGLAPGATLDNIMTAIAASESITDKVAFGLEAKTVYDAIVTNMEFCGSSEPFVDTYEQLAKLIQYLPVDMEDE